MISFKHLKKHPFKLPDDVMSSLDTYNEVTKLRYTEGQYELLLEMADDIKTRLQELKDSNALTALKELNASLECSLKGVTKQIKSKPARRLKPESFVNEHMKGKYLYDPFFKYALRVDTVLYTIGDLVCVTGPGVSLCGITPPNLYGMKDCCACSHSFDLSKLETVTRLQETSYDDLLAWVSTYLEKDLRTFHKWFDGKLDYTNSRDGFFSLRLE